MPVTGLPPVLESILTCIMSDSNLSSYKIAGFEQRTTIVLRFDSKPIMAEVSPVQHSTPNTASFRKKSPGELRRDRTRREQYLKKSAKSRQPEVLAENTDLTDNLEESVTGINVKMSGCHNTDHAPNNTVPDSQYFTKEVITDDETSDCGDGEDSMVSSVQHTTTTNKTYERCVDTADRPANKHICSNTPTTHNTSPYDHNKGVHKQHKRKTINDVSSPNQDHEDKGKDQNEGHFQDRPTDERSSDEEDDGGDFNDLPPEQKAEMLQSIRGFSKDIAELVKECSSLNKELSHKC